MDHLSQGWAISAEQRGQLVYSALHRAKPTTTDRLRAELDVAEIKAIDALARYKFQMFGYWAAIWVHLNRVGGFKRPSPFKSLVNQAKQIKSGNA